MTYHSKETLSLTLHLVSDRGLGGDVKNGNKTNG